MSAQLQRLESRRMFSHTFMVTSAGDAPANPGTLRAILAEASASAGPSRVVFSPRAFPPHQSTTIALGSPINVATTSPISIVGPGVTRVTLSGGDATTIFAINSTSNITIANLRLANGGVRSDTTSANQPTTYGGAINNAGTLILAGDVLTDNAADVGAGIYSTGQLTIRNCQVESNASEAPGAGAVCASGKVLITKSKFSGNLSESTDGNDIDFDSTGGGTDQVTQCTFNDANAIDDQTTQTVMITGCVFNHSEGDAIEGSPLMRHDRFATSDSKLDIQFADDSALSVNSDQVPTTYSGDIAVMLSNLSATLFHKELQVTVYSGDSAVGQIELEQSVGAGQSQEDFVHVLVPLEQIGTTSLTVKVSSLDGKINAAGNKPLLINLASSNG